MSQLHQMFNGDKKKSAPSRLKLKYFDVLFDILFCRRSFVPESIHEWPKMPSKSFLVPTSASFERIVAGILDECVCNKATGALWLLGYQLKFPVTGGVSHSHDRRQTYRHTTTHCIICFSASRLDFFFLLSVLLLLLFTKRYISDEFSAKNVETKVQEEKKKKKKTAGVEIVARIMQFWYGAIARLRAKHLRLCSQCRINV